MAAPSGSSFSRVALAVVLTPIVLMALLVGMSLVVPHARLWGINHLLYFSWPFRIVALGAIALAFVPAVARRLHHALSRAFAAFAESKGALPIIVVGITSFAAMAAAHTRTFLLGDGVYTATNLREAIERGFSIATYARDVTPTEHIYPLTDLLNFITVTLAATLVDDALWGARAVNLIAGAGFFIIVALYLRRSEDSIDIRMVTCVLWATSGATLVFFGYIENYTPLVLLGAVYSVTSFMSMRGLVPLYYPAVALALAIAFHVQGLLLVPSFVVVLVATRRRAPRWLSFAGWVVGAGTVVGGMILAWSTPLGRFLRFSGDPMSQITDIGTHMIDTVNGALLIFPMFFLLPVLAVVSPSRRDAAGERRAGEGTFVIALLVPALFFVLMFRPELGMARDWDLYAVTAVAWCSAAYLLVSRFFRAAGVAAVRAIMVPAMVTSAVLFVAWVGVNTSESKSVRRYQDILRYDRTNAGYAYESLARFYEEKGDTVNQVDALTRAYDETRNPRLLFKLSLVNRDRGETETAITQLYRVLESRPAYDDARKVLIRLLADREDAERIENVAAEGARISPQEPFFHAILARAFFQKGQIAEAKGAIQICLSLNPSPAIRQEMGRLIDAIAQLEGSSLRPTDPDG